MPMSGLAPRPAFGAHCAPAPSNCKGVSLRSGLSHPAYTPSLRRSFGSNLSPLADGSRTGFLKTCCNIHQGHYPCANQDQYAPREEYWRKASTCLGVVPSLANQFLRTSRPSVLNGSADDDARQTRANRWFADQQTIQARRFDL